MVGAGDRGGGGKLLLICFQSLNSIYLLLRNCQISADASLNFWSLPELVPSLTWMAKVETSRSSEHEGGLEMLFYNGFF